jgi:CBS domain-containing protein
MRPLMGVKTRARDSGETAGILQQQKQPTNLPLEERTMQVGTICTRHVATCPARVTVREAATLMRQQHVGNLVVVEHRNGEPVPVGLVTDRDIVVEVVAKDVNPSTVTAGDVMSRDVVTAVESEEVDTTIERMRWSGIRRIPIVNPAGVLIGIVTLDDIAELLASRQVDLARVGRLQNMEEQSRRP